MFASVGPVTFHLSFSYYHAHTNLGLVIASWHREESLLIREVNFFVKFNVTKEGFCILLTITPLNVTYSSFARSLHHIQDKKFHVNLETLPPQWASHWAWYKELPTPKNVNWKIGMVGIGSFDNRNGHFIHAGPFK